MSGGGYVYVIEFSNGIVKVGRSQDIVSRLRAHGSAARNFGIEVTRRWESPCHLGWQQNEDALKRLTSELGGEPLTAEFFSGVDFDALVEKARELPFEAPAPAVTAAEASAPQRGKWDPPVLPATDAERAIRLAAIESRTAWEKLSAQIAAFLLDLGVTPDELRGGYHDGLVQTMDEVLCHEAKVRKRLESLTDAERQFIVKAQPAGAA